MPNNPIPIALALLILTSTGSAGQVNRPGPHTTAPRGVNYIIPRLPRIPLGGLLGLPGVPFRIAPASISELEETLSGMLDALHTLDKFRDFSDLARTLSVGSLLSPEDDSDAQKYHDDSRSLPNISKLMEIAGPVIDAINSPR